MPRVALYTRVSTDLQAQKDEGSLDTQEARLRAAVTSRGCGWEIVRVLREEGESGKSLDRPEVQKLLQLIRKREVDVVMVTRLDRLSRSLPDFLKIHELLEQQEIQFWSLNENFDTTRASGRAMLKLSLVFAELEREQTAERTTAAMQARAERGLWNGGHPPLGYESLGDGHLEVIAAEAELVRLIFDKYEELRSVPKLRRWLNDRGHRQKVYTSRRRGKTGGKPFSRATVLAMLKNQLYLGRIEHKGEIYSGQHASIIEEEQFERVRAIIAGNARNRRGPPATSKHDYPLTGLLTCGSCGYSLTSGAGTGRNRVHHYYTCVGLQKDSDHPCTIRRVRAEDLEEAVLSVVRAAAHDPRLLEAAAAEAERMAREQVSPLRARLEARRQQLRAVERDAETLLDSILAAGLGASSLAKARLTEAEARLAGLRADINEMEGTLAARETEHLDLELLKQILSDFDLTFDHLTAAEKRDFLRQMIRQIVVDEDHIVVELYDGTEQQEPFEAKKARRAAKRQVRERLGTAPQNDETDPEQPGGSRSVRDGSRCWT